MAMLQSLAAAVGLPRPVGVSALPGLADKQPLTLLDLKSELRHWRREAQRGRGSAGGSSGGRVACVRQQRGPYGDAHEQRERRRAAARAACGG
eukprot:scaffold91466_cov26-Tisochrysis_lutea.AAC.2